MMKLPILRKLEQLERTLPPLPRHQPELTNEERTQSFIELQEKVMAGHAGALERTRYERCLEIFKIGRARMVAQQSITSR